MTSRTFGIGDHVVVPWGLDSIEGTVVEVFGPPGDPYVLVRVHLTGVPEDEGSTIGFKAHDVELAPAAST